MSIISPRRSSTRASFRSRRTAKTTSSPGICKRRSTWPAPAKGALRIERFSYTLTPTGEGAWTVKADRFPSLAFDVPTDNGKVTGALDLSGFRLDVAYDAAQANFLRSLVAADLLAGKFHVADADHGADFDLAQSGISVETRAKTSDTAPASTSPSRNP